MSLAPADDDDGFVAGVMSLAPADDDDGFVAGVMSLAPADDDDGFVAGVMSLAPADDDDGFEQPACWSTWSPSRLPPITLFVGMKSPERTSKTWRRPKKTPRDAEEEAVDAATCVDAGVVQVGFGVAPTPLLPGPAELVLVLVLWVGLAGGVEVAVEVPLGSGLGLRLTLGLVLGLAEGLELGLVVLPLLWLPLDDVAGAVVVWVAALGGLVLVCVADGCVDGDGQGVGVICAATPGAVVGPVPCAAGVGTGVLPLPSVAPRRWRGES